MTKIEEFIERVKIENQKCILCHGKENLEITEYEFQHSRTMLKITMYCPSCDITFSGHIY